MANVCRLMTEEDWPNGCITARLSLVAQRQDVLDLSAYRQSWRHSCMGLRNWLQHADEVRKQEGTLHAALDRALYLRLYQYCRPFKEWVPSWTLRRKDSCLNFPELYSPGLNHRNGP